MEWRVLIETVNTFMGLTIEVYPVESISDADLDTESLQDHSPIPPQVPEAKFALAPIPQFSATKFVVAPTPQVPEAKSVPVMEGDLDANSPKDPFGSSPQVPGAKLFPASEINT
jgi:hypothetical protein